MTAEVVDQVSVADLVEAAARRLVEGYQCRCRSSEWGLAVGGLPPVASSAVGMSRGCSNPKHHDVWRAHDVLVDYADRLRSSSIEVPPAPDGSDRVALVAAIAAAWRAVYPGWSRTDQFAKTIVATFETAAGVGDQSPSRRGSRIAARPTPGQKDAAADVTAMPALVDELTWLVVHGDRCAASLRTDPSRQCPRRGTWQPAHSRPLCWQHAASQTLAAQPATHVDVALTDHPTLHVAKL